MTMKRSLSLMCLTLAAGTLAPTVALADDATAFAFNIGAVTDYRYRGISQSRLKPAIQGGIDLTLPKGFYLGTWASSIKWIDDAGGNGNTEIDLYGGWKGEVYKDLTLDVGLLSYQYPSNDLHPSASTTELYGALTYSIVTVKYSHSVTNLFGFPDSKSSWYLEGAATIDGPWGSSVTAHVGHQRVENNSDFTYNDYSLSVSKDFNGIVPSLTAVGTSTPNYLGANGKDLGKTGVVLGVKYNF